MDNATVGISIGLVIKGLSEIGKVNSAFKQMSENIAKSGKDITALNAKLAKISSARLDIKGYKDEISNQMSNLTSSIAKFGTLAVPVKIAVDFESAMVDVKKYIDFQSDKEFEKMGKEIKELSARLGMSFSEIADIAASGGQQGLKADEIMDYTNLVAKFGVAFDMSGRDAGDAAAYIMNNFKLSTKELEKLGNQMNFLDDKMSMVKSSELFRILNRTSSNANILGLSADSASALGASMLSVGKAPEVASTALNSMYNALANLDGQDRKFHEALNQIGMDANYLKIALKENANDGIKVFLDALSKVDKDKQMGILTDMFGKQFSDDIGSLITNKDILDSAFNLIKQDSSGSLDEAMELKLKTTKSSFERLKASALNLGITIGNAFLPVVNMISVAITKLSNFANMVLDRFPAISKPLFGIVGGFLAWGAMAPIIRIITISFKMMFSQIKLVFNAVSFLTTVFKMHNFTLLMTSLRLKSAIILSAIYSKTLKGLAFVCGSVTKAFRAIAVGIRVVSVAMMSNPIGLILGAIALVAGFVILNWDKVKAWFIAFIEWIRPVFEPVVEVIKQIWQGVSAFFGSIIDGWKNAFSLVAEFIGKVFETPVNFIKSLFEPLFEWLGEKFGWISGALDGVKSAVSTALGWVGLGGDEKIDEKNEKKSKWYNPFSWGYEKSDEKNDEKNEKKSKWYNPFSLGDESQNESFSLAKESFAPSNAALATTSGGTINVNFSGDFNIATSNGKFDLAQFEAELTQSVKRAIQKENFTRQNRDIRG